MYIEGILEENLLQKGGLISIPGQDFGFRIESIVWKSRTTCHLEGCVEGGSSHGRKAVVEWSTKSKSGSFETVPTPEFI